MIKGIKEMTDQELQAAADAGDITASALVVEQERRYAAEHPEPIVEGWTLDRVMLRPGTALEELLYYRRRVQELLETANRYLERARAAEAFIAEKSVGAVAHIHKHGLKMLADGLRVDVYPTTVKHEHMRPLFIAEQPKTAGMAVKPLKWTQQGDFLWTAQTDFVSCYSVWATSPSDWRCSLIEERFASEQAAKSAAEADYERRIRAALTDLDGSL